MPNAALPPGARKLRRALYPNLDTEKGYDALHDLPMQKGISEPFFADLVVGCIWRYCERAERLQAHDRRIHTRMAGSRGLTYLKRKTNDRWPAVAHLARHTLLIQAVAYRHHAEVYGWGRAELRYTDPIVCLWALFRYLVRMDRAQGIEFYMDTYFPRILKLSGLMPPQAKAWTYGNVARHFRRCRGKAAADHVAFYLFSTDDRLLPYRPAPPPTLQVAGKPNSDLVATAMGWHLFRLPAPRKPAPRKASRGGQHPHIP